MHWGRSLPPRQGSDEHQSCVLSVPWCLRHPAASSWPVPHKSGLYFVHAASAHGQLENWHCLPSESTVQWSSMKQQNCVKSVGFDAGGARVLVKSPFLSCCWCLCDPVTVGCCVDGYRNRFMTHTISSTPLRQESSWSNQYQLYTQISAGLIQRFLSKS